jgi:hypothetical protein
MAPSIVKKNNLAVYAAVLLSGDNVEGEWKWIFFCIFF